MTWAKLDDKFIRHPKVFGLSDGAFRLHVSGIVYACEFETDGRIDASILRMLTRDEAIVQELVAARLWDVADGGWAIHDFLDWNPSKAELEAKRESSKQHMRTVRSNNSPTSKQHPANKTQTPRAQRGNTGTGRDGSSPGSGSRSEKPTEGKAPQVTARRLDPAWVPAPLTAEQLKEFGLTQAEADAHLPHFRDHWAAAKDNTSRDWQARWRNWLRSPYRKPKEPPSGSHRVAEAQQSRHERQVAIALANLDREAS